MISVLVFLCATIIVLLVALLIVVLSTRNKEPASIDTEKLGEAAKKINKAAQKLKSAADRYPPNYHGPRHWYDMFREYWEYTYTFTPKITTVCTHCKKTNRLRTQNLEGARCGSCKRLFLSPTVPVPLTPPVN